MALDRKPAFELINVHKVSGEKDAILFLKNSEKDIVEGLFYHAKRFGRAEFFFKDLKYEIVRNRDFSFTIGPSPDQEMTIEQFA